MKILCTQLLVPAILLTALCGCSMSPADSKIKGVLDRQVAAWNAGDIEGFMDGYWRSEELVFESPKGETKGWQATLDRYRQRYPTREKMGRLQFSELKITPRGPDTAEVIGRWEVKTTQSKLSGGFILQMRRIDSRWVITTDHTTSDQSQT